MTAFSSNEKEIEYEAHLADELEEVAWQMINIENFKLEEEDDTFVQMTITK